MTRNERIIELREMGWNYRRISNETGVGKETVRKVVHRDRPDLVKLPKVDPDTAEMIIRLRTQGKSYREIAVDTHQTVPAVTNVIKDSVPHLAGHIGAFKGRNLDQVQERNRAIIELKEQGFSHTDIADALGVARGLPHKVLKQESPHLVKGTRFRGEQKKKRDALLLGCYEEGMSTAEMAEIFGFTNPDSVKNAIRQARVNRVNME